MQVALHFANVEKWQCQPQPQAERRVVQHVPERRAGTAQAAGEAESGQVAGARGVALRQRGAQAHLGGLQIGAPRQHASRNPCCNARQSIQIWQMRIACGLRQLAGRRIEQDGQCMLQFGALLRNLFGGRPLAGKRLAGIR